MINRNRHGCPYCLVLSGGGAKGVYYIGVRRALKELKISVNAYIGNSIGAIMAGFFAQGIGDELEEIGRDISIDFILNVPDELVENGELKLGKGKFSTFEKFFNQFHTRKGLDTTPLRELLESHIDEDAIRNSGCDLGVVTFSVSDRKPRHVFIEEMEDGEVINYLLASSAFPGFELPEIKGKKYIDGGIYDNVPYAMARRRGYRKIIVVDIGGFGMKRKMNFEGSQTVHIKSSIDMGGVLDFNRKFLDRFTLLGYLDTMRAFGRLEGYNYFLRQNHALSQKFITEISEGDMRRSVIDYARIVSRSDVQTLEEAFVQISPRYASFDRDWLPLCLDSAATILAIERIKVWSCADLASEIRSAAMETRAQVEAIDTFSVRTIRKIIGDGIKKKKEERNVYFYHCLLGKLKSGRRRRAMQRLLREFSAELALGVFVLENPRLLDL